MLIFAVFIMNFAASAALVTFGNSMSMDLERSVEKNKVPKKVCQTPGCVRAAAQISDKIDASVHPCDDFYRFSCGRYIKKSIIPDDKANVNVFEETIDKLEVQLRRSIESEITDEDPEVFKLLRTYYYICMDTDQIEKTGELEFRDVLKKLGGWPVLQGDSWDESSFDWKKSMYKFKRTGYSFNSFVSFGIVTDWKNNTQHMLGIEEASLPLSRKYLIKGFKERVVKAYHDYLIDLAEILGADRKKAELELLQSVNFSIELAKITSPSEELRNVTKLWNVITLRELESKYPIESWSEYINELMAPHVKVYENENIVVAVPSFLDKLFKLISRTPKRVLANYAMSDVVTSSALRLGEQFYDAKTKFAAIKRGVKAKLPRWKKCLKNILKYFPLASDALYVRRHFDKTAKAKAVQMADDVRNSFRQLLIEVDWMDEQTKNASFDKLDKIMPYIGYPDEFLDNAKLDENFKDLKMYPESFLRSHLGMNLRAYENYFKNLRKPVNKTDWKDHGSAAVVNAYYGETDNSIQIPAGILQGEFFSKDRPNYLNYGGIGSVMGHEISHGFDDQGRQFDKDGNLVDWWNPETKKKFLERAKCIIEQYSNHTVKEVGLNLNGVNSQGENIADNGGMKAAYFAYKDWEKRHGQEARLPGLPYTSQQLFWISAANVWCEKNRLEDLKSYVLIDKHSPGEFRVNVAMSNMPAFSEDFKCPPESPMNPVKKCTVW